MRLFAVTAFALCNTLSLGFHPGTGFVSHSSIISSTSSSARFSAAAATEYNNAERYVGDHPNNNIPPHIADLVGRGLHEKPDHPLGIINAKIKEYFVLQEEN